MRTKLTAIRSDRLRQMLTDLRHELQTGVRVRIRDGRTPLLNEAGDTVDESDAGSQRELAFALLQMRTEALACLDQALARLDSGEFGSCWDCECEITEARLRALPFAVRCKACEERREQDRTRNCRSGPQDRGIPYLPPLVGVERITDQA